MNFLWVCLGGAIGSGARYLVGLWAVERFGSGFPWGTLAVNLSGSLLLGALMRTGEESARIPPGLFVALTIGVMGGFTTYSTFNFELLRFAQDGHWGTAAGYAAGTFAGALAAGLAGYAAARAVIG